MEFGKIRFSQIFKELTNNKKAFENGYLYLPKDMPDEDVLELDTEVYFGEPTIIDDETDEELVPMAISQMGFDFGYLSEYLFDVYENLSYRHSSFNESGYLKAFNYYIEHDTFIPDEILN